MKVITLLDAENTKETLTLLLNYFKITHNSDDQAVIAYIIS
jgi:hypothetical protein